MVESKARMPEMNAQRLCMDAKPTKRSFKGKDIVQGEGIVRVWKVNVSAVALIHSRNY